MLTFALCYLDDVSSVRNEFRNRKKKKIKKKKEMMILLFSKNKNILPGRKR